MYFNPVHGRKTGSSKAPCTDYGLDFLKSKSLCVLLSGKGESLSGGCSRMAVAWSEPQTAAGCEAEMLINAPTLFSSRQYSWITTVR